RGADRSGNRIVAGHDGPRDRQRAREPGGGKLFHRRSGRRQGARYQARRCRQIQPTAPAAPVRAAGSGPDEEAEEGTAPHLSTLRSTATREAGCAGCRAASTRRRPALARNFLDLPRGQVPASACAARICASTAAIAVMLTTRRTVAAGVRIWAGLETPMRIGPRATPSVITRVML